MRAFKRDKLRTWVAVCSYGAAGTALALNSITTHAAVLEQVIVEAQKKSETAQDTPVAVSSVSGDQFQQSASFNLSELARSTAGLSIDTGATPDIHLRGTSTVSLAEVSMRTNFYINGALIEQPQNLFTAQYDIARFEILRGPQGTLYGKSSPTGTINIRTQNPNLTAIDGYVSGSLGQRDLHNGQFAVSVPIIENELGVRIAAVYDESKTGIKNVTNGSDGQDRASGARFTALWEPNDKFSARASFAYNEYSQTPIYTLNGQGFRYYDDKATTNFKDRNLSRDQLSILELIYNINDHLGLTSVTSYEDQDLINDQDIDGTASTILANPAGGFYNNLVGGNQQKTHAKNHKTVEQDLRLSSDDNDFWDWQVGSFYKTTNLDTPVRVTEYSPAFDVAVAVDTRIINSREEWAAYTHNTFKFTDQFNLIVGLRAARQRATATQPTSACVIHSSTPDDGVCVLDITGLQVKPEGIDPQFQKTYAQPITGTLKAQYFFDVDLTGYITLDRAYRVGAANVNVTGNVPTDFAFIKDEAAKSAEVGLKGSFWDQRASFTVAVFDQIYSSFQQDVQNVTVSGGNLQAVVVNAKEAEIRGVETEVNALVLDNWQLGVSLTYIDAKFNDFKNNPCTPSDTSVLTPTNQYSTCDLSGKRLPMASKWAGVASSNFSMPAFAGIDWYFNTLLNARSDQIDKVTRETLGGYATVDFFTGLRASNKGPWDVSVWLKNAFDRRAITRIVNSTSTNPDLAAGSPVAFDMVNTNPPRQVGMTGTYRF
ncbi:MAG TPA: TonB-dependent receptor [Spongiibacteraceae bacterium]